MREQALAVMPKAAVARPAARTGLSPDWLPVALLIGDSIIAGISVLAAYWYRFNIDRFNPTNGQELDFGPYLVDQLLSLYSGIALAAVLMLAAISITNTGLEYSRLTLVYSLVISTILMTIERYVLLQH